MKPHYPVEIHYSAEDEGFLATFPDLPGCSAWGSTEAEALDESHAAAKQARFSAPTQRAIRSLHRQIPRTRQTSADVS